MHLYARRNSRGLKLLIPQLVLLAVGVGSASTVYSSLHKLDCSKWTCCTHCGAVNSIALVAIGLGNHPNSQKIVSKGGVV